MWHATQRVMHGNQKRIRTKYSLIDKFPKKKGNKSPKKIIVKEIINIIFLVKPPKGKKNVKILGTQNSIPYLYI